MKMIESYKDFKRFLTVKECAHLLRINPYHLYRLTGKKAIPYLKIPGIGLRFNVDELEHWLKNYKVEIVEWEERIKEFIS